jgi:tRNA uridine 5-carbamoylmethylation protein Kti12
MPATASKINSTARNHADDTASSTSSAGSASSVNSQEARQRELNEAALAFVEDTRRRLKAKQREVQRDLDRIYDLILESLEPRLCNLEARVSQLQEQMPVA